MASAKLGSPPCCADPDGYYEWQVWGNSTSSWACAPDDAVAPKPVVTADALAASRK
jgi:hypothetical protein